MDLNHILYRPSRHIRELNGPTGVDALFLGQAAFVIHVLLLSLEEVEYYVDNIVMLIPSSRKLVSMVL
ncbi:hypothetical protein MUK42_32589 [Musa troglodytarum]|uniref:Uncharacterized protein n=1 Tax=Musa troglodytarum TaxID=320322 RepID=A0A9E7FAN9_9LILI|nr:hypothetical protein MUK42_32589 [Musa troglodytarum]